MPFLTASPPGAVVQRVSHRVSPLPRDSRSAFAVPQCRDVKLSAAYLAEESPGQGSGFLITIANEREVPVAILDPPRLSVDWYAESNGRWSWRASSGSGGSLTDASKPRGAVFVGQQLDHEPAPALREIPPHGTYMWAVFSKVEAALRFRPGCQHCSYKDEDRFRAVLAYAYLPALGSDRVLRCGLRSAPVVMPPLESVAQPHNSGR